MGESCPKSGLTKQLAEKAGCFFCWKKQPEKTGKSWYGKEKNDE